jgi:hypothetical protein
LAQPATKITQEFARRATARVREDVERFAAHPWYGIERGWIFTFDEHPPPGVPAIRPIPRKAYIKALVDLWFVEDRCLLEKSRQLMVSWIFSYLASWDAWTKYNRHNIFQGKRQEDVNATGDKGLLGRARFMRDHLPPHIKPTVTGEATTYETYNKGSTLEALPEGKDKIRSKVMTSSAFTTRARRAGIRLCRRRAAAARCGAFRPRTATTGSTSSTTRI